MNIFDMSVFLLVFIFLGFMMFFMKILWEREKEARIDREEKIESMYNEIMGKNEKEVENEK